MQLLLKHHIEIEEVNISSKLMKKLNKALLSSTDVENISNSRYVRPIQIYEYIYAIYENLDYQKNNNHYYSNELPYHLIDSRIFDLALKFKEDPNSAIMSAFTRLEDIVRKRSGLNHLHSTELFKIALSEKDSPLTWNSISIGETQAKGRLFVNIYQAFRNARAHKEADLPYSKLTREFLLVNELFLLESEAIERKEITK
ncbi:TIGR02391 family protein [Acinetobacter silvestris]|uniref:TIGR02391 family protein n=1 Tax=Acinetobacter silvestris TaxID=1977882 RepID=UPI002075B6A3|nr:TIGR02391 family protein [Acinetobacter silvestris]